MVAISSAAPVVVVVCFMPHLEATGARRRMI
jgi:hypothetical protein